MSAWIEGPSVTKPGRIELRTAPGADLIMPLVFLLSLIAALGYRFATFLVFAGFAFFLAAKLSLIAQGIHISWGSSRMSPSFRRCYRAGYALMTVGVLAALVSLRLQYVMAINQ